MSDALIRQWVWMETMAWACSELMHECKGRAVPSEEERRYMPFDTLCRKSYQYALDNWAAVTKRLKEGYHGSVSGHTPMYVGYWFDTKPDGFRGRYKQMEVAISFGEVRAFIEKLLAPETMADRQMTMLDLLAMEAHT